MDSGRDDVPRLEPYRYSINMMLAINAWGYWCAHQHLQYTDLCVHLITVRAHCCEETHGSRI